MGSSETFYSLLARIINIIQGNSNRMAHAPFHTLTLDISCIGEGAIYE
jgi:hypothetical protein